MTPSTTTTTLTATFRAKTNSMKSWRPRNPPSNRDRLELYALHKQSVSGDAPAATTEDATASSNSVADKAKLAAWRAKRGMTQVEAMQRYVEECECLVFVLLPLLLLPIVNSIGNARATIMMYILYCPAHNHAFSLCFLILLQ